jgi:hypothetical protein
MLYSHYSNVEKQEDNKLNSPFRPELDRWQENARAAPTLLVSS